MIDSFFRIHPLAFYAFMSLAFLTIIAKAGDYIIFSMSDYAKKLGISDYLIGLVVISIGTATSEMVASVTGTLMGNSGIVFGTVLGSSLCKLPIIGLGFIIAKKIKIKKHFSGKTPKLALIIAAMPMILVIDGVLSRTDGILLLLVFALYLMTLWQGEGKLGKIKRDVSFRKIWQSALIFSFALAALLYSARWLVFSSLQISEILNVPPLIVGLVVLGIGSSMPELAVQIKSIKKKHVDIAMGNVFGSIVANSVLVLGVVAIIRPVSIDVMNLVLSSISLIAGLVYLAYLMKKGEANWKHGIVLILFYVLVIAAAFYF